MKKIQLLLFASIFFIGCNTENKENNEKIAIVETVETEQDCLYSINKDSIIFEWTAFKTTKKIPVSGTFNTINTTTKENSSSLRDLLSSTQFDIDIKSTNSNNEGRDKKLVDFFFSKLKNEGIIKGLVSEVEGNENGIMHFVISMNGIDHNVQMEYYKKDDVIIIDGDIDIINWNAKSAVESLNSVCKEKHTGEDGVTKTWSTVHISIKVPVISDCK